MKKYLSLFLLISLISVSCGSDYSYPENKELSDKSGALIDSAANFIPQEIVFKGEAYTFNWDKERLAEINEFFLQTSEPVLYNYYLGRDIYRLVLVKKGERPLLLSINKRGKTPWIVSKRIDLNQISDSLITEFTPKFDNYSRELTSIEAHSFDSIFQTTDFFQIKNSAVDKNFDNYFLLEAHESDRYWIVYQAIEDKSLENISTYIKALTGF